MDLYQKQIDNEKMAYSIAADNKRETLEKRITTGNEHQNGYCKSAMWAMSDVSFEEMTSLFGLRNQHTKRFWWNHVKPAYEVFLEEKAAGKAEAKDNPLLRLADMIAYYLGSTLSKEKTRTTTASDLFIRACWVLRIDYDLRQDLEYHGTQFFGGLLDIIAAKTEIFTMSQEDQQEYRLFLSPEWKDIVKEEIDNNRVNVESHPLMIVPPKDHHDLFSGEGGFLDSTSPLLKSFARGKDGKIPQAVRDFNSTNNPEWFGFINRLQATPYRINKKMLKVLLDHYDQGYTFGGFPVLADEDGVEADTIKKVAEKNKGRKKWADRKNEEYKPVPKITENKYRREFRNKDLHAVNRTLGMFSMAEEYAPYENIWFNVFSDKRGRIYTYASGCLSYQGNKMSKSLLEFGEGQVLTADGVDNLFESLGNALGFDKMVLEEKSKIAFEWFGDNKETFEAGDFSMFFLDSHKKDDAVDPANRPFFDEPINALCIVLEILGFMADPENYKCHYIAHRDARVSGPSIICTAFRDLEVMMNTSVVDYDVDGKLGDQYTDVGDFAKAKLYKLAKTNELAADLKEYEHLLFTRKHFKDLTMTYIGYGLSDYSVREKNAQIKNMDWGDDLSWDHKVLFDEIVLDVLQTSILTCDRYLKITKEVAKAVSKRDGIISYINPLSGFPVAFSSRKMKTKRMVVQQPGGEVKLSLKVPTTHKDPIKNIDCQKIVSAAAPGFTHSVDAALLFQTAKHVDGALCFIHDSMSTNINNVKQVVKGYGLAMTLVATTDPFNQILEQLNVEQRYPMKGTATLDDIKSIQHSKHILA